MNKIVLGALLAGVAAFGAVNVESCKSCHGQNWEKAALGKSKVVAGMKSTTIEASLKGYQLGTYGGTMAGVMKGQVTKFSDKELTEIAKLIGTK